MPLHLAHAMSLAGQEEVAIRSRSRAGTPMRSRVSRQRLTARTMRSTIAAQVFLAHEGDRRRNDATVA
jgi:hypothetical protein